MECSLCQIQYVGKAETPFNIRLNNHRKDANGKNPKAVSASIHFKQPGHNFNKHAKFTLIEQTKNTINRHRWYKNKNEKKGRLLDTKTWHSNTKRIKLRTQ